MLSLLTYPAGFGEPSHSPFCVKAMILLEMSGRDWQREDASNPSRMPHGKMPVLRTPQQLLPDSEFIQDWLAEQGADFFPGCTPVQRAQGQSITRMVEENLRLLLVHDRWLEETNWARIWPVFFAEVPRPIRKLIAGKARKSVRIGLLSNGIARMDTDQRLHKARNDLRALGDILGDSRFLLGDAPTAVDAAVLPVLSMIDRLPVATPLTHMLRDQPWAKGYLQRGRQALYPAIGGQA